MYMVSCCYDNHFEVLEDHTLHHEWVQLYCGEVEVAVTAETALQALIISISNALTQAVYFAV